MKRLSPERWLRVEKELADFLSAHIPDFSLRPTPPSNRSAESSPKLLIAVSGGADSMALLGAAYRLRRAGLINLVGALLIHHPDIEEALARADLVRKYCQRRLLLIVEQITSSDELPGSPEEKLRTARYHFLEATAQKHGCAWILTAHHADDQVETVLLRFLTGTGLRGLRGIPERRGVYLRPFLNLHKTDLITYCQQQGLPYLDDPSNWDKAIPRNRLRHDLLPRLRRTVNPEVDAALLRLRRWAAEANEVIDAQVEACWQACVCTSQINRSGFPKAKIVLDIKAISPYLNMIQKYTVLKALGLASAREMDLKAPDLDGLVRFLRHSKTGSLLLFPGGVKLTRHRNHLIVMVGDPPEQPYRLTPGQDQDLLELGLRAVWSRSPRKPFQSGEGYCADFTVGDQIQPLLLRCARTGDRFFPLGAPGEKSLYRFLTDRQVSRLDKPNTLVVEVAREILWVIGHRVSEKAKIRSNKLPTWRLTLTPFNATEISDS